MAPAKLNLLAAPVLLAATGCLSAPERYVAEHGRPAWVEESAGDMGRSYAYGAPQVKWRTDALTFYYPDLGKKVVFEDRKVRTDDINADDLRMRPAVVAPIVSPESVHGSVRIRELPGGRATVGGREFRTPAELEAFLESLRPGQLEHGIALEASDKADEPRDDGAGDAADAVRPFCERRNVDMFWVVPTGKDPGLIVRHVVSRRRSRTAEHPPLTDSGPT